MKKVLGLVISLFFFFLSSYFWASYPWTISGKNLPSLEIKNIEVLDWVASEEKKSVLKILTWNIGYLYGEGSAGDSYQKRGLEFYQNKLEMIKKDLKSFDADVVFLQEIDFDADRSHRINQAFEMAKSAGYPYFVELTSWKSNYVPFPYWPIENHFGHMNSGGAILSRYPILSASGHLLEKPKNHPWWYNLFYLHRYLQVVEVEVTGKTFRLMNLHLEAFDKSNREDQVKFLIKKIENLKPDFVAGDFNMVPRSALKKNKFNDSDDYEGDRSFDLMEKSGLSEVIPDEIYALNEKKFFTYPSIKPDRRLDYIYFNSSLKLMKAEILSSQVSDHLPVKAYFQIGPPKVNPYSL